MLAFYDEEVTNKEDGSSDTRVVIRFPFNLAPIKYAIMPLVEKSDEMVALSKKITDTLRQQ
jgi:glycyl-tRNA synthetase